MGLNAVHDVMFWVEGNAVHGALFLVKRNAVLDVPYPQLIQFSVLFLPQ
jgi:hypothetical protein